MAASSSQDYISPIMQQMTAATLPSFQGGTVSQELIRTINDADAIETAVGGEQIFTMMNRAISQAQHEVLIQTFAYERDIPAITELRRVLEAIAERKAEEQRTTGHAHPLRLYLLIDERGPIAHYAFTGKKAESWPVTPESVGLFHAPGLVEIYVDTHFHNTMAGNHAKTVVIDNRVLMITGANFQASNYGHIPAHDAGWLLQGDVAHAAREDFAFMWAKRKNGAVTPDLASSLPTSPEDHPGYLRRPVSILFTSCLTKRVRRWSSLENPQNCAFAAALKAAERIVQIATPNLNAPFIIEELLGFLRRGGRLQLLFGNNFNARREATAGMGGNNQYAVDVLFNKSTQEMQENLDIRWFSLNGRDPVIGNVAGACHLKFMAIDWQVAIVGNANLDVISTEHLHEVNLAIDDAETTAHITRAVFDEVFRRGVPARPSEGVKETFLEKVGYRGWQEILGMQSTVEIAEVVELGEGYRTLKLRKPEEFVFMPGQYLEIRSGGIMSKASQKSPAILAIASGTEDGYLEVTARGSRLHWHTNHCLSRKVGQTLQITGPLGTPFPIELLTPATPLFLLGGGSGLTVLRSLYRSVPTEVNTRIFYSAPTESSLLYREEIDQWRGGGRHLISLTQEQKEGFESGRITGLLEPIDIPIESFAFICGSIPLIGSTVQLLLSKGLPATQIFVSLPFGAMQGGPVYRADHPRVQRLLSS